MDDPTNLKRELDEQRRWTLLPRWSEITWFGDLVRNEFREPARLRRRQDAELASFIEFAGTHVPYYRELLEKLGLRTRDIQNIDDLPKLPVLSKSDVHDNAMRLRATDLPAGEQVGGQSLTKGVSGPKIAYLRTARAFLVEHMLTQRQYRWFRYDPHKTLAWISAPQSLQLGQRSPPDIGEMVYLDGWPGIRRFFSGGPFVGFSAWNSMTAQIDWLLEHQPEYLRCTPTHLEYLALSWTDRPPWQYVRGMGAAGEPLSRGMKTRIEDIFGVPVDLSYGLDELGWVATRCAGNRYHVHIENNILEIVDGEGQPCHPGEPGRIVVTIISNLAMPIIRIDTGDVGRYLDDHCPCGRTLPSIASEIDSYALTLGMAPELRTRVECLRRIVEHVPRGLAQDLRKYQIHRVAERAFELRLLLANVLSDALRAHLLDAWSAARGGGETESLTIMTVDDLARGEDRRFHYFVDHVA